MCKFKMSKNVKRGGQPLDKKQSSSKKTAIILGVFALTIVTTAASFAFFTYSKIGQTTSTITSGDISFTFEEGKNAELVNAFPVSDTIGANDESGEYTFDVKMNSSSNANVIDYNVYLIDNNKEQGISYFKNNQIKFALIKNGTYVAGTSENSGKFLSDISGFEPNESTGEGLVLTNQEISANQVDNYKLRIWISNDVDYSNTINGQDEQTSVGKFNGYTYSLRVKVTSGSVINQYVMGGYLTDNDGNPLVDKTMVVYSNTPHYVKSDSEGYFLVENLEDGEHEIYYMGDKTIDELKSKTKDEIISSSLSSSNFNTKSTSISFNDLKVNNLNLGRTDKMNVVTLKAGNNEIKKITSGNTIQFKVNDVSNYTNIYSNNGSELSYNNGIINVSNISKNTDVILSTGLGKTTDEMDMSKNYVLMISDEKLINPYECYRDDLKYVSGACINGKNIILNVNNKKINSSHQITIFSNENTDLKIIGEGYIGNDISVDNSSAVLVRGSKLNITSEKADVCSDNSNDTTSGLCISGQYSVNNWNSDIESYTYLENISSNGIVIIRNGNADLNDVYINHGRNYALGIYDTAKTVNINGGIYISKKQTGISIQSTQAVLNINDYPTYISASNDWGIYNQGTLNINANKANQCTDNYQDTTSGLCIYGIHGITNESNSVATINNGTFKTKLDTIYNRGDITINGGEFYSDNTKSFVAYNSSENSKSYINGGYFESYNLGETIYGTTYPTECSTITIENGASLYMKNNQVKGKWPVLIAENSTLNMCSGEIFGTNTYDVSNKGIFNYSTGVKFTDGTNIPKNSLTEGTLNPNYTGTCFR